MKDFKEVTKTINSLVEFRINIEIVCVYLTYFKFSFRYFKSQSFETTLHV